MEARPGASPERADKSQNEPRLGASAVGRSSRDPEPLRWETIAPFADAAFRAVFDSSAEALLVIDAAGVIQRANHQARKALGIREASIARAALDDFLPGMPPQQLSRLGVEGMPPLPPAIEASSRSGASMRITLRAVLPGSENMLLCVERAELAPQTAATAEGELQALIDSVSEGVLIFEAAGVPKLANRRFGEIFGLVDATVEVGTSSSPFQLTESVDDLFERIAPRLRDPAVLMDSWSAFVKGEMLPLREGMELIDPAGHVLERRARPVLDAVGHAVGWIELFSDVTGERHIERKMLQTEKMAALGQLVSGIAHELNNPLTTITGYAQLLLAHPLSPMQLSEARSVYQEAERARRIVKNLLYFARENPPQRVRVDLNEVVERALALRSYELRVKNIAVICDLAPDLPPTMADPFQLQQVLLNLIVNAEQALIEGRGHGQVEIRTRELEGAEGKRVLLEVSDDGPGIPSAAASRIFDPFFTTKASGAGTGLGLSIVYGIIRQHGGEVSFENRPSGGVTFVVDLPVVDVPSYPTAMGAPDPEMPSAAKVLGRILVVEDEPSVAHLLTDILSEEGHQVEAVLESQEGLARLARSSYDLVICDLRMPRLDGRGFYEALINSGSPASHRVLFITGDTMGRSTHEFLESTKMPVLAKPFLVEEVKLAVRRCLEGRGGGEALPAKTEASASEGRS